MLVATDRLFKRVKTMLFLSNVLLLTKTKSQIPKSPNPILVYRFAVIINLAPVTHMGYPDMNDPPQPP